MKKLMPSLAAFFDATIKIMLSFALLAGMQTSVFSQCPNNEADLANGGTFSGYCNVYVGNSITITGNVIWTSGTLSINGNNGDINISGSLTINGGTVRTIENDDGSLAILDGGQLTVSNGATFQAYDEIHAYDGADITVSGTLQSTDDNIDIDEGATLTVNSGGTVDADAAVLIQGTMTSAGTVHADDDITLSNTSDVTVSSTGSLDADRNIDVSGTLNNSGDISTDRDLTLSGTVNNSGDLHADDDIYISGTVTNNGNIEARDGNNDPDIEVTGTLVNNGTVYAEHDIALSSTSDVTVNASGSLDARNDISLGGDLVVSGEVDGDEVTIPDTGDVTINSGGSLETSDDEDLTVRGDLKVYGTVDVDDDMWVDDGGNVTVYNGGELSTDGDLRVVDHSSVTINGGGSAVVGGDLTNDENTGNGGADPSQGTIVLNGTMEVHDDVRIYNTYPSGDPDEIDSNDSALIGSGTLIVTDIFDDNESPHGDFYSCGGDGETCMGSGILPVTFLEFTAESHDGVATIDWKTAIEINNYGFYVERSTDGLAFDVLGFVEGHGNSKVMNAYTFEDRTVLPGMNYYRLKQVDYDGAVDHSKIIALEVKGSYALQLYPNPGSGNFKITGLKDEQYAIKVSSLVDKSVVSLQRMNAAEVESALNRFFASKKKGLYIIIFQSATQIIPVKYVLE